MPRAQPIQPLPLPLLPEEPHDVRPWFGCPRVLLTVWLQQPNPSQPSTDTYRRDARLDTLNQEADALSYRLEGLLRTSRRSTERPSSDPMAERTSPATNDTAVRSFSTSNLTGLDPYQRYSSPDASPLRPVFGSDSSLEARLARTRPLLEQQMYPGATPHSRTRNPVALTQPDPAPSLPPANAAPANEVDWNAAVTLDDAVYLDRDGDQSPTFGPVFRVELLRGTVRGDWKFSAHSRQPDGACGC